MSSEQQLTFCCFRCDVTRGPHDGAAFALCVQQQPRNDDNNSITIKWTIGRRKKCHLRLLSDLEVSSSHAELEWEPATRRIALRDLQSTNGTRLNGEPLAPQMPHSLKDGDLIAVGKTALRFRVGNGVHASGRFCFALFVWWWRLPLFAHNVCCMMRDYHSAGL